MIPKAQRIKPRTLLQLIRENANRLMAAPAELAQGVQDVGEFGANMMDVALNSARAKRADLAMPMPDYNPETNQVEGHGVRMRGYKAKQQFAFDLGRTFAGSDLIDASMADDAMKLAEVARQSKTFEEFKRKVHGTDMDNVLKRSFKDSNEELKRIWETVDESTKIRVFHGTTRSFDDLSVQRGEVGVHFGTLEQAQDRLRIRGARYPEEGAKNILEGTIELKNPLRMKDLVTWQPGDIIEELQKNPPEGVPIWEINGLQEMRGDKAKAIVSLLEKYGFDGIVYKNAFEGGPKTILPNIVDEGFEKDSFILFDLSKFHRSK